jgi:hypothetical protein
MGHEVLNVCTVEWIIENMGTENPRARTPLAVI